MIHSFQSPFSILPDQVAAVFATMNRAQTAEECLKCISLQTSRPAGIFVTDNASTDNTPTILQTYAEKHDLPLTLISLSQNLGNAGGVQTAVAKAFSQGFQAVWILDDDSWPEAEALEALLDPDGPQHAIRTSLVLAPDSDELSWLLETTTNGKQWQDLVNKNQMSGMKWVRVRRSWLGSLITQELYAISGPLNGDLFLRGEDEAYPRTLERQGYHFWMATRSILRHPKIGPLSTLSIGANKVRLEQGLSGDKLYYRIRNMLWIKRNHEGILVAITLAGAYFLLLLRSFRPVQPCLKILVEASWDAATNRLGKRYSTKHVS